MIMQVILTLGLLSLVPYAFVQRQRSRFISLAIAVMAFGGIYFVLVPASTDKLAHLAGIGRGADLVLYCWVVISLMVSMNLHFKNVRLQASITELAREMALREAAAAHDGTHEGKGPA